MLIVDFFQLRLVIFTRFLILGGCFSAAGNFAVGKGDVFDASENSIVILENIKGGAVGLFGFSVKVPHL